MTDEVEEDRVGLNELAERCEAATGPDRDLNADIIRTTLELVDWITVPDFTASLDAAMTLLDPSWFFHVSRFSEQEGSEGSAHVYPNRGLGDDYEANAKTPTLALCAAALKARAQTIPPKQDRDYHDKS